MDMRIKSIFLLFLIMCLITVLAACGAKSSDKSGTGNKSFKGIKITHIAQSSTNRAEAYKAFAIEFQEKTGATVEIVDAPYEQLHDKLINDLITKTGAYDVMDVDSGWDGEMAQQFEPLKSYIEESKMDMNDYLGIYQKAVGLSSVTKGERYGLPLTGQAMAMFYRTDLLKQLNLNVPTTWDEFDAMLPQLKSDGVHPFVTAGVNVQLNKLFYSRYVPQGQALFNAEFVPQFNGPEGVKAIEGMKKMFEHAPQGILAMDNPDANQLFLNGQAAILITWPNTIISDLQDANKSKVVDNWAVTAPPGPGNARQIDPCAAR